MTGDRLTLLLIQADRVAAQRLQLALADIEGAAQLQVCHVASLAAAQSLLASRPVQAVLYDLRLDASEVAAGELRRLRDRAAAPILLMTEDEEDERAHAMIRAGAADDIVSQASDGRRLMRALRLNLDRDRMTRELEAQRREAVAARTRFHNLVESSADGVLVLDREGIILFANTRAAAMLERPAEQIVGDSFGDPAAGREPTELTIMRRSGSALTIEIRMMETLWDGVTAFVATLRDISARKETERALRQAKQQAEWANEMKTQFLANMSHELRTPLNSILGFSEMIASGMFGPIGHRKYGEYARDIHRSASHLLGLISDLLDISRAEAGRFELENEPFDVAESLGLAARTMKPKLRQGGLGLDLETEAVEGVGLRGDERRIQQVLLNLLSNAIKFTPPGGRVRLSAGLSRIGNLVISVSDTGIGMDPERVEEAFQAYVQVSDIEIRRSQQGTGLGLAVARTLVEQHDGWMEMESEPGRGTQVSVVLPAERVVGLGEETTDGAEGDLLRGGHVA